MKNDYLNLPVNLCIYAVKNQAYSQFRLYIYLKASSPNGFIIKNSNLVNEYCKVVGISKRSFLNHFNWLLEHKWVYRVSTKGYIVESFAKLLNKKVSHYTFMGAQFNMEFKDFRNFVTSAVVTYFGQKLTWTDYKKYLKKINKREQKVDLIKWRIYSGLASPSCFILPIKYFSSILDIPKSSAQSIFLYAGKYIKVHNRYINTNIEIANYTKFKKYSEYSNKVLIKDGKVCIQDSNLIKSKIILCKLSKKIRKFSYPN